MAPLSPQDGLVLQLLARVETLEKDQDLLQQRLGAVEPVESKIITVDGGRAFSFGLRVNGLAWDATVVPARSGRELTCDPLPFVNSLFSELSALCNSQPHVQTILCFVVGDLEKDGHGQGPQMR